MTTPALFRHVGVGDFYHRSLIPARSAISNKGKLISQAVSWINHCSVRLNRHTSDIYLIATTTPEIAADLKLKGLQTYVKIEIGTQFGKLMELTQFNFRPIKVHYANPKAPKHKTH